MKFHFNVILDSFDEGIDSLINHRFQEINYIHDFRYLFKVVNQYLNWVQNKSIQSTSMTFFMK